MVLSEAHAWVSWTSAIVSAAHSGVLNWGTKTRKCKIMATRPCELHNHIPIDLGNGFATEKNIGSMILALWVHISAVPMLKPYCDLGKVVRIFFSTALTEQGSWMFPADAIEGRYVGTKHFFDMCGSGGCGTAPKHGNLA